MLGTHSLAALTERIGETFRIHSPPLAPVAARLVAVTPPPGGATAPGAGSWRAPFTIVLRGPRSPVLPQRSYRIEHDALGTFELYLAPIGQDREGMRYEAILA